MSEILDVLKVLPGRGWWLILDCQHWYKWTQDNPPKPGEDFRCPNDSPITVKRPQ